MNYGLQSCFLQDAIDFLSKNGYMIENKVNPKDYGGHRIINHYESCTLIFDIQRAKLNVNVQLISDSDSEDKAKSKAKKALCRLEDVLLGKN